MTPSVSPPSLALLTLRDAWAAQWPPALSLWSKFTRLNEPRWCFTDAEAEAEGLTQSFAMIRLADQAVVVNLSMIEAMHLERFALEILAHEIGHHVYAPADLSDYARMIAHMRWGLPTKEHLAGFISNLYTDLLINDRLQRSAGLETGSTRRDHYSRNTGHQRRCHRPSDAAAVSREEAHDGHAGHGSE